jgi:hypothetical protein
MEDEDRGRVGNSKERQLNCMFTNVRSLMNNNKLDELKYELLRGDIDVLGIAESWTNENITDAEIALPGYEVFRRDRGEGRGGGVLLYIKDKYSAVNVTEKTKGQCETVWASIRVDKNNALTVGVCYRSPAADQNYENNLLQEIAQFVWE